MIRKKTLFFLQNSFLLCNFMDSNIRSCLLNVFFINCDLRLESKHFNLSKILREPSTKKKKRNIKTKHENHVWSKSKKDMNQTWNMGT